MKSMWPSTHWRSHHPTATNCAFFKLLPLWNLVENDLPRDDDGIHRVRAPISLHSIEDEIWELYRIAVVLVTCFEVTKDVTSQTLDVFALGHPSFCRFGCFMMCCRMRILRTKHSRRVEKSIAVSFWTYRLLCPLIVFLAFTKEVIAGWNLEATEATEARVLLVGKPKLEKSQVRKTLGVPLHNFAGKALQSLQAYHLVQRGFSPRVQCRFALLAVLCGQRHEKRMEKLVLLLLPLLTRILPKFPRFRFDLLNAMSWYSYTFLRNLWRAIYTRDAQRDSQDWKLRRDLVCLALSQRLPQNGCFP